MLCGQEQIMQGPLLSRELLLLPADCQPLTDLLIGTNLPLIEVADELKTQSTSLERLVHIEACARDGWEANRVKLSRRWCISAHAVSQVPYLARTKPSLPHPAQGEEGWSSLSRRVP